ncbi:MAG: prephenate dehydrogenase/arogenate dehydrogenase family protein [Acidobacteriota bacterium]|nr:prephenate dehydrogenase/arogenate dehydrogenase family protein [Acidobacteriota bacterium]MDE3043797.1 prephenate dehydrogenase/arogenate dehydrogenase family protein [Acidobacteriota bacterium]MDE3223237.1 prephenate dehydrogenase/arogenate dehydrogenase family protein [Acidobacteriota bacterium]
MTSPVSRRAHVVGLGLIGSSLALALRDAGWTVSGTDVQSVIVEEAVERGFVRTSSMDDEVELVIIATPAGVVVDVANEILQLHQRTSLVVTDVAGVKGSITAQIRDPRFIGGHPMAGSELRGFAGARSNLFQGCTWVLTPTTHTTARTYGQLHGVLRELGANVVAVEASDHDRLVAVASHVPHLLAGALMNEAARVAEEDAVLLQLAAGGFRDMTRVAAGDPSIWPDVLFENRDAVAQALSALEERVGALRRDVENGDRESLTKALRDASRARRQLPGRALDASHLAYLRVGVSDQPGVLSRVTTAASELLVNIYDIEIAHGIEGSSGTLLLAVADTQGALFASALREMGFSVGVE